eukprot:CAMPEP_0117548614 /NCGR_PEP_ID=MMETSP0784-20121206/47741_1 /TAXON_ID=39447 /ORGANISM="" /LENGTH=486 /DNA_ID=CAMNT_0005345577 /DNA_START=124 /DNA_END=1584 /DNA_ORIENTATION=+
MSAPRQQDEVLQVRALGDGKQRCTEGDANSNDYALLLARLRSHTVRSEVEKYMALLTSYQSDPDAQSDAEMDALIKSTSERCEVLVVQNERTKELVAEAEKRVSGVSTQECSVPTEEKLQAMSYFERQQLKIEREKQVEELSVKREDAKVQFSKITKQFHTEVAELRDLKLLSTEFKRMRLEKIEDHLTQTQDGVKLRACIRDMIRHGGQHILQKLEVSGPPLEPWMRAALVNMCHIELEIEERETSLVVMRRQAVQDVKHTLEHMHAQSKEDRLQMLCLKTWDTMDGIRRDRYMKRGNECHGRSLIVLNDFDDFHRAGNSTGALAGVQRCRSSPALGDGEVKSRPSTALPLSPEATGSPSNRFREGEFSRTAPAAPLLRGKSGRLHSSSTAPDQLHAPRIPADEVEEIRRVEAEVQGLSKLLQDTKDNIAAVVCNRVCQHRNQGVQHSRAMGWGLAVLTLLISGAFAKRTIKTLEKSVPTGKMTP